MNPIENYIRQETRRQFFGRSAKGLGLAALASLFPVSQASGSPIQIAGSSDENALPHFAPRAKRAIYLFMSGAPSQLEMYDYKPKMKEFYDKELPESIRNGQRLTTMTSGQSRFPIVPSKFKFKKYDNGGEGMWVSDCLLYTSPSPRDQRGSRMPSSA